MDVDRESKLENFDVWINGNRFRSVKIDDVQFNVIKDIAEYFQYSYTYPFLKSLPDTEIKKLSSDQLRELGYPFSAHGLNTISQTATFEFLKKVENNRRNGFISRIEMYTYLDVEYNRSIDKEKYVRLIEHRIKERFEISQLYSLCCGVEPQRKKKVNRT